MTGTPYFRSYTGRAARDSAAVLESIPAIPPPMSMDSRGENSIGARQNMRLREDLLFHMLWTAVPRMSSEALQELIWRSL
jgi:hypothetical protein